MQHRQILATSEEKMLPKHGYQSKIILFILKPHERIQKI